MLDAVRDPNARARWSAPEGDELVYDHADFPMGGQDLCRCGSPGALINTIDSRYLDVVADACMEVAERTERQGARMDVALNTVEL